MIRAFRGSWAVALGSMLVGCVGWPHHRSPAPATTSATPPTAAALVAYLNDNSKRLHTVDCGDLDLDAKQKNQAIGLTGWMVAQKARNFRLAAKVAGNQMVDIGSNDHEFWFWIGKSEPPYLFHCSYEDFHRGQARLPLPFQPEWIMQALGMADYGPPEKYQVSVRGSTVELIEPTTLPSGQRVRKVVVFNRQQVPQVTAHLLQDEQGGKIICAAYILEHMHDRSSGAVLPKRLNLVWPEERMELKMRFDDVVVNRPIEPQRSASLFTRPRLANVPSYDLARGPDAPGNRPGAGLGLPR
ncbi:MAG: hypothetical protein NZ700_02040 [Gemmataceae bacterium]|nr:hypothetical protein [Gemmataceae bacterium]MDW8265398.1 hypothetical protein [Gemmataceae bacterium]